MYGRVLAGDILDHVQIASARNDGKDLPLYPVIALIKVWKNRAYTDAIIIQSIENLALVVPFATKSFMSTKIEKQDKVSHRARDSKTTRSIEECSISLVRLLVKTR